MIKTIWQKIKPILIIAGVMTVPILGMLLYTRNTERLPETPGVSLYLGWAEDTPGSYYHEMSRSGFCNRPTDEGIWHSKKEYDANYTSGTNDWNDLGPDSMPLSIWSDSLFQISTRFWMGKDREKEIWFALRTKGSAEVETIAVRRWPVELIGSDEVKEDSWYGREKIDYEWKDGGFFRLSKGHFTAEPGYLYSIYVLWSRYGYGRGWNEYSFVTIGEDQYDLIWPDFRNK